MTFGRHRDTEATTKQRFEELAAKGAAGDPGQPLSEEQEVMQKTAAMRETVEGMKEGQFPTTKELASALESVRGDEEIAKAAKNMSPEGQEFMADTGEAIDTAKATLLEKNRGDELQKMMYHATKATEAAQADRERLAGTGKAVKSEALAAGQLTRQAVEKITNVAKLTVTSSEFRTLLTELTQLFREAVLTNATEAADDQPKPAQQEQGTGAAPPPAAQPSAKEQQWQSDDQRQQQEGEQQEEEGPSSNVPLPPASHDEGSQQARGEEEETSSFHTPSASRDEGSQQAWGEGQEASSSRTPSTGRDEGSQQDTAMGADDHRAALKDTAKEAKNTATRQAVEGAQPYLEQLKEPDVSTRGTLKDAGSKLATTMREHASTIRLTDEQRDALINRVKGVIREVHSSDEYTQAIEDLLDILSELKQRAMSMAAAVTDQAKQHQQRQQLQPGQSGQSGQSDQQTHMLMAVQNAKALVEHFANNRSLDPLHHEIQTLMQEMRDDKEFGNLASDTKGYLMRALRDVTYLDDPDFSNQGQELLTRTRDIAVDRYHYTIDRVSRETDTFLQGFREDKMTQQLGQEMQTVLRDMFTNEEGKPTVKMNLARDLARLIPILAQRIKFIPIPRIEGENEQYEYAIDNLVVSASNLLPEHVRFSTQTDITKPPEEGANYDVNNLLSFSIRRLHAAARGAAFYYKKKTGVARMADAGYADIVINGRGLDIATVAAAGNPNDDERSFQVLRIDTFVHDIDLTIRGSKRDFLYKLFAPIVRSAVRKRLEEGIAVGLLKYMILFDKQTTKAGKQSTAFAGDMARKAREGIQQKKESLQEKAQGDPEQARDIPLRGESEPATGKHAARQPQQRQQHGDTAPQAEQPLGTDFAKGRQRGM